ncbi:EAL and HDOD domain-containing protein [Cellulomonas aerilata]|uniref:Histidine kinase n=1 Tax=Cellulomonas aerilata TaxID=515326 RepID=A0A512DED5_9CELL|nr:HDOD domain-containing protein [Cellulomonas aerilata]GEO34829.1 histidine kinase [Cellulomonas aerilata]
MSTSPTDADPGAEPSRSGTGGEPDAGSPSAPQVTVHRQPVVDPDSVVRGYAFHLAIRTARAQSLRGLDPELLVHGEYDRLDLGALTGGLRAFVRATSGMLTGRRPLPQPAGGLVLEVPAAFTARPDASGHLARLRAQGVGLALSDYRPGGYGDALLDVVDLVKVDLGRGSLVATQAVRRAHAAGRAVVAERVDSEAAVTFCRRQSVELMQGPLFPRDTTATARELSAGQLQCLELMQLLSAEPVDSDAVVAMVGSDPELSMRVLRLVNLSTFAVRRTIDSVPQAVVLAGPRHLATLAMTSLLEARTSAVADLWFVLARALACRALAGHDGAYTVGLLSAVAGQLRIDPAELVARTGVSPDVRDSLSHGGGPWGPVLTAVLAHEADDAPGVEATGLSPVAVSDAYLDAVGGAFETATSLAGRS